MDKHEAFSMVLAALRSRWVAAELRLAFVSKPLTRAKSAIRDLKGTPDLRPTQHRKEMRVETHLFICVLAYQLQVAIERTLQAPGDHTNWETLREELRTHQIAMSTLPTADSRTLAIRRSSIPEWRPRKIYHLLNLDPEPMKPIEAWA